MPNERFRIKPYECMVKVLSQLPTATTDEQLDRLLPWHQEGAVTPKGKALTPEHRRSEGLKARCKRLKQEKDY